MEREEKRANRTRGSGEQDGEGEGLGGQVKVFFRGVGGEREQNRSSMKLKQVCMANQERRVLFSASLVRCRRRDKSSQVGQAEQVKKRETKKPDDGDFCRLANASQETQLSLKRISVPCAHWQLLHIH